MQSQKAVTAYFSSEQVLPFGFAVQFSHSFQTGTAGPDGSLGPAVARNSEVLGSNPGIRLFVSYSYDGLYFSSIIIMF